MGLIFPLLVVRCEGGHGGSVAPAVCHVYVISQKETITAISALAVQTRLYIKETSQS